MAKIWPKFGQILAKFWPNFAPKVIPIFSSIGGYWYCIRNYSFNNVAPTCLLRLPVYSVHTSCLNWMITIHRFDLGPVYKGHLVIAANFLFSVWWSLYTGMNVNDILGPVCNGHMFKAANFSFLFSGHRFDC